jgi:hypothetical protein
MPLGKKSVFQIFPAGAIDSISKVLKNTSSKYHDDSALFQSDDIDADAEFSIIFGFSDPLVQRRYLEYKRDRVLPGVITTLRLSIVCILAVWIGIGIVLSQAIQNYSLLQFALIPLIYWTMVYLLTFCWERGILDLSWERQLIILLVAGCCIIGSGFGSLGWREEGNAAAVIQYYGPDPMPGKMMLQWQGVTFPLFFIVFGFVTQLGVSSLVTLSVLLLGFFAACVHTSPGLQTDIVTLILSWGIIPIFSLLVTFPAWIQEEQRRTDFLRVLFFDKQTKALKAQEAKGGAVTTNFAAKMDSMITDGSLREVYFRAGSADEAESKAAQAQLSYFLMCMDQMTSSQSSSTGDSAKAEQVLRRLKTAGTALRIADRWFSKLKFNEHQDKGVGWQARPSGSNACDVFVSMHKFEERQEVGTLFDNAGVSFTSTEDLAHDCQIFLHDLEVVQHPKAAAAIAERICTGRQVVLFDSGSGSELKEYLKHMAGDYGVPCFLTANDAAESICSGSSAKTALPGKQVYVAAREKFVGNEVLLSAASSWQQGEIDGAESVSQTESCDEEKMKGMAIKPIGLRNPIFTHFVEGTTKPRPEVLFYEDDEMLIFPNVKVSE